MLHCQSSYTYARSGREGMHTHNVKHQLLMAGKIRQASAAATKIKHHNRWHWLGLRDNNWHTTRSTLFPDLRYLTTWPNETGLPASHLATAAVCVVWVMRLNRLTRLTDNILAKTPLLTQLTQKLNTLRNLTPLPLKPVWVIAIPGESKSRWMKREMLGCLESNDNATAITLMTLIT